MIPTLIRLTAAMALMTLQVVFMSCAAQTVLNQALNGDCSFSKGDNSSKQRVKVL